jgi:hypothetical protein
VSLLWFLQTLFVIWMLVECFRRGQTLPWAIIILFFQFFGALVYFILEVQTVVPIPGFGGGGGAAAGGAQPVPFRPHRVTGRQLSEAETEVRRLDNAAAWSDYASLLCAKSRHAEAEQAAATSLEKDPEELEARYVRGRSLLELGRAAEAVAELEKVLEVDPGHDYGDARLALAKALEATGELEAARGHYERLGEGSSRPDVLYHLAEIQHRTGDAEAARSTLQRIVDEAELAPSFARRQSGKWVARAKRTLRGFED